MDIKCELVNKPQIIHKYQGTNEITSRIARIVPCFMHESKNIIKPV